MDIIIDPFIADQELYSVLIPKYLKGSTSMWMNASHKTLINNLNKTAFMYQLIGNVNDSLRYEDAWSINPMIGLASSDE
jgi:hypothetical protein